MRKIKIFLFSLSMCIFAISGTIDTFLWFMKNYYVPSITIGLTSFMIWILIYGIYLLALENEELRKKVN